MENTKFRNDLAKERFDEAEEHSKTDEQLKKSWEGCLQSLKNLRKNLGGEHGYLEFVRDFAPLSLSWAVMNGDGACVYNGGLIFHGPTTVSHEYPVLSVTMDPSIGWQLHS
jgi:hypothetical protein